MRELVTLEFFRALYGLPVKQISVHTSVLYPSYGAGHSRVLQNFVWLIRKQISVHTQTLPSPTAAVTIELSRTSCGLSVKQVSVHTNVPSLSYCDGHCVISPGSFEANRKQLFNSRMIFRFFTHMTCNRLDVPQEHQL